MSDRVASNLLLTVVTVALAGCAERVSTPAGVSVEAPRASRDKEAAAPHQELALAPGAVDGGGERVTSPEPLQLGREPFARLPVPGFADAVVSVPLGRTKPAPIVIAGHGNYDRPEWQCSVWRGIVETRAFVLCPRGIARPDSPSAEDVRFTYASAERFVAEVEAGLAALRTRYGAAVAAGPVVVVGFSLGALFGVRLLVKPSLSVDRAVLVEGGHSPWSAASAAAFARVGGKRVLFACGQPSCVRDSEVSRALLEKHRVEVAVVASPREGHSYAGAVAEKVHARFDWLIEGDPRFASE